MDLQPPERGDTLKREEDESKPLSRDKAGSCASGALAKVRSAGPARDPDGRLQPTCF